MGQETMGPDNFEQVIERDGKKYRLIDTGYTVREYFSHETRSKGPGPGWDRHLSVLEEYGVSSADELPDTPYYRLEELE